MRSIAIAIDGPAGAGKSTIAKLVADRLGILYIDTGAMYRCVTLSILERNIRLHNEAEIRKILNDMEIHFTGNRIFLNSEDVTEKIRLQEVNNLVSTVSAIPFVREKLVEIQRNIASDNNVIMDGRDIGTHVLKDANVKIFLTASIEERAKRRYMQSKSNGDNIDYDIIKQGICDRDRIDSTREVNPLRKADDAIVVDTTSKSIEAVVEEILDIIKKEVGKCCIK